jgi:LPXTG-motif cell wall-anchored protein
MSMTIMAVASPSTLPRTGGAALPLGLAGAGLATAIAGIVLRRRAA